MKFVCERCHTKYSIADDKVRQKILKIRCKTCENVITVRDGVEVAEADALSPGSRPAPPPPPGRRPGGAAIQWHLAINGKQTGPFGQAALIQRILAAGKDDEVYVWHEELDGWKEPKDVPALAAELQARPAAPPAPPPARKPSSSQQPAVGAGGQGLGKKSLPPGAASVSSLSAKPGAARASLPPPGSAGRSTSPPPGASADKPADKAGTAGLAAAALTGYGDGDEDRTQIQPLDAALLLAADPSKGKSEAKAKAKNGATPDEESVDMGSLDNAGAAALKPPLASGLEGLNFGAPAPTNGHAGGDSAAVASFFPSSFPSSTGAMPAVGPAPNAPAAAASQLSQLSRLTGLPGFFGRHPAIKYVATGSVLVGLIIVVAVIYMTGGSKPKEMPRPAIASPAPSPGPDKVDPEAQARAEAEARFRTTVGEPEPAVAKKTVAHAPAGAAARRPAPIGRAGTQRGAGTTPPPNEPPPLAPPPVGATEPPPVGAATGGVAQRFEKTERRVGLPVRRDGDQRSGASFDQADVVRVINQPDHKKAVQTCYQRGLKLDNTLKGKLTVKVAVGETGSVRSVNVDAPAEFSSVSSCIRDTVKRWRFPSNSESYDTEFPLILHQGSSG